MDRKYQEMLYWSIREWEKYLYEQGVKVLNVEMENGNCILILSGGIRLKLSNAG